MRRNLSEADQVIRVMAASTLVLLAFGMHRLAWWLLLPAWALYHTAARRFCRYTPDSASARNSRGIAPKPDLQLLLPCCLSASNSLAFPRRPIGFPSLRAARTQSHAAPASHAHKLIR